MSGPHLWQVWRQIVWVKLISHLLENQLLRKLPTRHDKIGTCLGKFKHVWLVTRSHLKSVFLIFKMSQKKAEFSHLKKLVPKNTEILRLFLQEM